MTYEVAFGIAVGASALLGGIAGSIRAKRKGTRPAIDVPLWAVVVALFGALLFGAGALLFGLFYFLSGPTPPGPLLGLTILMSALVAGSVAYGDKRIQIGPKRAGRGEWR